MTAIERNHAIVRIEKEMRELFALPIVNDVIVDRYNYLERQWKQLTEYKERTRNPLQGEHTKKGSTIQTLPYYVN
jgi:hypothetical protein